MTYDVVSSSVLPLQKSFSRIDDTHLQPLTLAGLSSEDHLVLRKMSSSWKKGVRAGTNFAPLNLSVAEFVFSPSVLIDHGFLTRPFQLSAKGYVARTLQNNFLIKTSEDKGSRRICNQYSILSFTTLSFSSRSWHCIPLQILSHKGNRRHVDLHKTQFHKRMVFVSKSVIILCSTSWKWRQ